MQRNEYIYIHFNTWDLKMRSRFLNRRSRQGWTHEISISESNYRLFVPNKHQRKPNLDQVFCWKVAIGGAVNGTINHFSKRVSLKFYWCVCRRRWHKKISVRIGHMEGTREHSRGCQKPSHTHTAIDLQLASRNPLLK